MTQIYNAGFFEQRSRENEVADIILNLILPTVNPRSVVDLGTAVGTWPAASKRAGVERAIGIDGRWVPREKLQISSDEFVEADLEESIPDLGRFDLAVCTEVLEHLTPESGERAVKWLCDSAPVVLFSAAIPGQDGTGHINEAWQSHWASRFAACGYMTYDLLRPLLWGDERIPVWYRQNLLLMASQETGERLGFTPSDPATVDLVHPVLYRLKTEYISRRRARSLKSRLKRLFW